MERHQIIEMMRELRLSGMRAAFDEILANGLKRQHSLPQIIGDLLQAEIAEKQARSIGGAADGWQHPLFLRVDRACLPVSRNALATHVVRLLVKLRNCCPLVGRQ